MEKNEILKFIANVELLKSLSQNELSILVDNLKIEKYAENNVLFEQGSPKVKLFIVLSGEIELFKSIPFKEVKRLAVFSKGDFLGEGSLMDDDPHSVSARSSKSTTVLTIKSDTFHVLSKTQPEIAYKVFATAARVIARRLRQASTRVVDAGAQYLSGKTRREHDLLGDRDVPYEFYYGVQTLRGLENFNITGISLAHYPILIESLAIVKKAAASANDELGILDSEIANAIKFACNEILIGKLHTHFVIDMIQGGAGTSTNMNANEVIANRALELLGHEKGEYEFCHPNNHVNLSQSTNDAYPTALKIALITSNKGLTTVLANLVSSLKRKSKEFAHIIKMGRTQLQDAVPMTMGQTFEVYASTLEEEIVRLDSNADLFLDVNMGGTAIGTGINAHPDYSDIVVAKLRDITGYDIKLAANLMEATQDTGAFVMYSSAIKRLAVKLSKIANDLRLLSSGPRTGINEINLPVMQPGSSIMPGKVNPVIPEVVNQICYKVIGNDLTITMAAEAGQLELNVMEPIILQSLFESIEMLINGIVTFDHRCIEGITVNEEICRAMVGYSIGLVTALNPVLGYEVCTELAKEALERDCGVQELVLEKKLLTIEELDRILSPENMIGTIKN